MSDYDFTIMKDQQTLFDISTNILNLKAMLEEVTLDIVFAHGDAGTTFVTALACFCYRGEIIKCDGERE